jgi:hypothetical protein
LQEREICSPVVRIDESIWNKENKNWRKLHNEQFNNLYPSVNIFSLKSRRMKGVGTCSRRRRNGKCEENVPYSPDPFIM